MIEVGEVVGARFEIERILGRGGMGEVVAARHLELGHRVALKFLQKDRAADPDARARFLREARAAVRLRSEHVARVLDMAIRRDGTPYIVMELLDGADLASVLRASGPLPIGVAVDWVLQVCKALVEAHAAKIVHRDLKPENLFLCRRPDGTPIVKVIDFGISKVERRPSDDSSGGGSGDSGLTTENRMLGSIAHMSPEQIRSARAVDARADVWALGVILFQFLTGKVPFEGETAPEVLRAILERDPPRVRDLRPQVPAQLDAVVLRCLEKDRDARFGAVKELVLALERALKDAGIERTEIWWPSGSLEDLPSLQVDIEPTSTRGSALLTAHREIDAPSVARLPVAKKAEAKGKRAGKGKRKKRRTETAAEEAPAPAASAPVSGRAAPVPSRPPLWGLALLGACVVAAWFAGSRWGQAGAEGAHAPAPSAERAHVTVDVRPASAKLVIDGRPVPNPYAADVPRDGASHRVEASAPGYVAETRSVAFVRDLTMSMQLAPEPSAAPSGVAAGPPPMR